MGTKIAVKLSAAGYTDVKQPFCKLPDNQWYKAKRVLVKSAAGVWEEVWPGAIVYIHTGYGYNMNIAACFGNPTTVGNYFFINNGKIGGDPNKPTEPALRTGILPEGSELTIINNGAISGFGGQGGTVYGISSGGGGGTVTSSCFTGDCLITLADGKTKPIEEIVIGDLVKTAFGTSEVVHIQTPLLGERKLLSMLDGKCKTSAEHPLWTRDKITGESWWSTRDLIGWTLEQDAAIVAGLDIVGPVALDIQNHNDGTYEFATLDGWVDAYWMEIPSTPDTQLYHLHLKDGGGYFVDGFLVEDGGLDYINGEIVQNGYRYGDSRWVELNWKGEF